MDLSERKQKILHAIIEEYIGTAEPVGSRVLSKHDELGLSSATIRNEMADLEDMGYLVKPHTSAGRVPSDTGYRFYVNSLMQQYQMSVEAVEQLKVALEGRVSQLDMLLKKASMITSALTQYTTVVTSPTLGRSIIRKIDLINMGVNLMLIVVTRAGLIKNRFIPVSVNETEAVMLSGMLNRVLGDVATDDITEDDIIEIQKYATKTLGIESSVASVIVNYICEAIYELGETDVYINNARALLSYPEFSDLGKAREMLDFLENKEKMIKLIGSGENESDVSIKIGTENNFKELENSSLVTVNYRRGDKIIGRIGVIGPKRMNYAKVIASLDCISSHIDSILEQLYNLSEEG